MELLKEAYLLKLFYILGKKWTFCYNYSYYRGHHNKSEDLLSFDTLPTEVNPYLFNIPVVIKCCWMCYFNIKFVINVNSFNIIATFDGENISTDDSLRRLNNKGLVERDYVTKKDTFYLYKAEWNSTDKFVHICGKNYTKTTDRVIKCYTNDGNELTLYVNNVQMETVTVTNHIATFTATNFNVGDIIRVDGMTTNDTFIF